MKFKILIALIIASLIYIINILTGLFAFQSLKNIFQHGIISFAIVFILSYLLISLIELLKRLSDLQALKKEMDQQPGQANEEEEAQDEFSPMKPPVVEYEEKKGG